MFLQSLYPGVNLLSLYKDKQGKFIVFKVIKLTLIGERSSLDVLGTSGVLTYHNKHNLLSHVLISIFRGQILQEVWVVTRYLRSMTLIPFWGWR